MVGTQMRYFFCEEKIPSLNDKMKIGAFADYHKKKLFEQELIIPHLPTLGKLFPDDIFSDRRSDNNESSANTFNNSKNSAASKKEDKDSKKGEKKQDKKDEKKDKNNGNASSPTAELTSQIDSLTMVSTNDDFIMVDLKTPFASVTEKSSELGRFYQEWQTAPPLQEFVDLAPLEQTELTKQLETFESQVKEYENIVQSLCQSPNNN